VARRRRTAAKRVSATKAQRSLAELLSRVRFGGEEFIIERAGKPVAKLGRAAPAPKARAGKGCTYGEFLELTRTLRFSDEYRKIMKRLIANRAPAPPPPRWP
jgi:antitoxin (DNA-binding transcriptional repressor) of toxin-antitoxin stability system